MRSLHSNAIRFVLVTIAIVISTTRCMPLLPVHLPDTDIVFQSVAGTSNQGYTFGFVNMDGSGLTIVNLHQGKDVATFPTWSANGGILVFWGVQYAGGVGDKGLLYVLQAGKTLNRCPSTLAFDGGALFIMPDGKYAFLAVSAGEPARLVRIDLDNCKVTQTLIITDVYAGSTNSNGNRVVFQQRENIIVADSVNTLTNTTMIGRGVAPRWSPDSQWIAYTAPNGIYVVRSDGTDAKRVVVYNALRRRIESDLFYEEWPPVPSWSPDGKWLVYHKCMLPDNQVCTPSNINQYSIFKVNIETGAETKILDSGLNPYWRWR